MKMWFQTKWEIEALLDKADALNGETHLSKAVRMLLEHIEADYGDEE